MVRLDKRKKLRPSILDRLIDDNPGKNTEAETGQYQKLRELRQSVRRDLENLLNTRLRHIEPDDEYSQLKYSLLNYGLPDLATVNISNIDKRKEFVQQLERLLLEFEPRFKTVNVIYQDDNDSPDRTLRFRIDATLYADPSPEVVIFDSVLEPLSRTVSIEDIGHA